MSRLFFIVFCLCGAFLFCAQNFYGQRTVAKIHGAVTDEQGAVIPNALITVKMKNSDSDSPAKEFQNTTTVDGEYSFENLPAGNYSLKAEWFTMAYENENLAVHPNQSLKLDFQLCYGGCSEGSQIKPIEITDEDKKEIVNQVLEDALIQKHIPDYNLLTEQKGAVILSTENISAEWVKPPTKINLRLMSEGEIQSRADSTGDFLYLSFAKFKAAKMGIVVTISNGWAVGKGSGMAYLSGGGTIYLFKKDSGRWSGHSLGGWIS